MWFPFHSTRRWLIIGLVFNAALLLALGVVVQQWFTFQLSPDGRLHISLDTLEADFYRESTALRELVQLMSSADPVIAEVAGSDFTFSVLTLGEWWTLDAGLNSDAAVYADPDRISVGALMLTEGGLSVIPSLAGDPAALSASSALVVDAPVVQSANVSVGGRLQLLWGSSSNETIITNTTTVNSSNQHNSSHPSAAAQWALVAGALTVDGAVRVAQVRADEWRHSGPGAVSVHALLADSMQARVTGSLRMTGGALTALQEVQLGGDLRAANLSLARELHAARSVQVDGAAVVQAGVLTTAGTLSAAALLAARLSAPAAALLLHQPSTVGTAGLSVLGALSVPPGGAVRAARISVSGALTAASLHAPSARSLQAESMTAARLTSTDGLSAVALSAAGNVTVGAVLTGAVPQTPAGALTVERLSAATLSVSGAVDLQALTTGPLTAVALLQAPDRVLSDALVTGVHMRVRDRFRTERLTASGLLAPGLLDTAELRCGGVLSATGLQAAGDVAVTVAGPALTVSGAVQAAQDLLQGDGGAATRTVQYATAAQRSATTSATGSFVTLFTGSGPAPWLATRAAEVDFALSSPLSGIYYVRVRLNSLVLTTGNLGGWQLVQCKAVVRFHANDGRLYGELGCAGTGANGLVMADQFEGDPFPSLPITLSVEVAAVGLAVAVEMPFLTVIGTREYFR